MISQILALLLGASLVAVQGREIPFPFQDCIIHQTDNSSVLFCDGPDSIPNRYIVKFKQDATFSEIAAHLESVNATLPGSDCSFGDWLPPLDDPNCQENCTRDQFLAPASISVDGGDGFVICEQCNYSDFNLFQGDRTQPAQCGFSHIFDSQTNSSTYRGYAAALSANTLVIVLNDPIVEYVSTDRIFTISSDPVPPLMCTDRQNAQPNLVRISTPEEHVDEAPIALQSVYQYDTSAGINQNLYVVDTGVRTDHVDLPGVQWLANFYGTSTIDDNGHGSNVAGIIRSDPFGVLPNGQIYAIKVLSSTGSGSSSNIIAGLLVAQNHFTSSSPNAPSISNGYSGVINFSIQYGGRDLPTEDALKSASDAGITVVVAAGNFGVDACTRTPGAAPGVIVVGAIDQNDDRSVWSSTQSSNFGKCVDIWAPGTNIVSISAFGLNTDTSIYSGTSQATPHVSGIVAGLQTRLGPFQPINFPYLSIRSRLLSMGHWAAPIGKPNDELRLLAYNGEATCPTGSNPPMPPCTLANLGEMQCQGTGFITCDYSGWVYRDCGPGTKCHPGNPLFCGY